jgi:hypothetical protein
VRCVAACLARRRIARWGSCRWRTHCRCSRCWLPAIRSGSSAPHGRWLRWFMDDRSPSLPELALVAAALSDMGHSRHGGGAEALRDYCVQGRPVRNPRLFTESAAPRKGRVQSPNSRSAPRNHSWSSSRARRGTPSSSSQSSAQRARARARSHVIAMPAHALTARSLSRRSIEASIGAGGGVVPPRDWDSRAVSLLR